ncbi:MAG: hypothetical protein U9Q81_17430 [Pseudomonadota bacterium]|nr:hypothetical protein [Pseudomonadota bacterium]
MQSKTTTTAMDDQRPRIGDRIEVPAWRLLATVLDVRVSRIGNKGALILQLQEHPQQPVARCEFYRVEPGQWRLA